MALKTIAPLQTIARKLPVKPVKPPPATPYSGRPDTSLGRPTLFPRGPEVLGLGVKRRFHGGVPPMPVDFDGSVPEWVWYYVSMRKLSPGQDPLRGPYTGAADESWLFQVPEMPGEARQVGNSISDFVYVQHDGLIIVRIEGFYWHTGAPPAQQARDAYLTQHAGNAGTRVERVEDFEFMDDISGGKAGALLGEILGGVSRIGAIHGGTAVSPRYADFMGVG
jgi:hypothetical protein